MAGRKTFTAGEILTSADVNSFLMDQTVMVFDDDTARGSAIPSPSEGMTTYLKDQDAVEFFDGSQFRRVGGLVDVKSVLKTDTFSASVGAGNNVAVTDLEITHTLSNASNKLLIMAFFGAAAGAGGKGQIGIAVADDGTLIGVGNAAGSRVQVAAGGFVTGADSGEVVSMPHIHLLYAPGDTSSHTYTVRVLNVRAASQTLYVNRSSGDGDNASNPRAVSAITIQEVAV